MSNHGFKINNVSLYSVIVIVILHFPGCFCQYRMISDIDECSERPRVEGRIISAVVDLILT